MEQHKLKTEIKNRIREMAEKRRYDAGMAGSMGDNGAAQSERELRYWLDGINFARTGETEVYSDLVQTIKNEHDPEYQKYLELKEKFEGKNKS